MRYIRFLKIPCIIEEKSSKSHISCLITITSDLGDSFLPHDISLSAELRTDDCKNEVIVWRTVRWTAGMRSLAITLPLSKSHPVWPLRVRVGVEPKRSIDEFKGIYTGDSRSVVSAWSARLDTTNGVNEAEKLVERRLDTLRIWEETGESIARHVWDAGVSLSFCIDEYSRISVSDSPLVDAFEPAKGIPDEDRRRLRVLELGAGCGIVGITVAQIKMNTDVILTDLPEAEEIIKRNIAEARPERDSTITFRTLDWEEDVPPDLTDFDTIIAADCTYNPDSSPALVNTLRRLSKSSPNAIIVIAMKKRHSSEEVFFDLMAEAGFKTADTMTLQLPGDEKMGEENVEVYFYRPSTEQIVNEQLTTMSPHLLIWSCYPG